MNIHAVLLCSGLRDLHKNAADDVREPWRTMFCCPSLLSHIAARSAFWPPAATYRVRLTDTAGWVHADRGRPDVEGPSRGRRRAILHSHGNACDLGQMFAGSTRPWPTGAAATCSATTNSGHGGRPGERDMYADIDAAWDALRAGHGVRPRDVVLYGQRIGAAPTVDLAARRADVGAVVLHSPMTSAAGVAFPARSTTTTRCRGSGARCTANATGWWTRRRPRPVPERGVHGTDRLTSRPGTPRMAFFLSLSPFRPQRFERVTTVTVIRGEGLSFFYDSRVRG